MLKLRVGYPTKARRSARSSTAWRRPGPDLTVEPVVTLDDIAAARGLVDAVFTRRKIHDYIVESSTRPASPARKRGPTRRRCRLIEFGASPRASIALALAAKAHAFLRDATFVTPPTSSRSRWTCCATA
jgi:MoxR-like ATPase